VFGSTSFLGRLRAPDGSKVVYERNFTIDLPDGRRVIISDEEDRYEDVNGNDLGYVPGILEAYEGYLESNRCSHPLYAESRSTFDRYNALVEYEEE
jgi:hypothetical protein